MKFTNVMTRVLVAFIAIPLILAAVIYGGLPFLFFVSAIMVLSQFEFLKLGKIHYTKHNYITSFSASISIILLFYFRQTEHISAVVFLLIALTSLYELFRKRNNSFLNTSITILSGLMFGIFFSSLIGIREFFGDFNSVNYYRGAYLVGFILSSIWMCDSAAYFGGTAFGKHRLLERISPKKSWEGAIFGFVFTGVFLVIGKYTLLFFLDWQSIVVFIFVIGIIGQMGDLVESMFKRNANIKDSSGLIPGHGGVYDRFDSLMFVAPFVYYYLIYFYNN